MIPFRFPGVAGVSCAFSTRAFGNLSLVLEHTPETVQRRTSLAAVLGVEAFAEVHQVHGVRTVFEPDRQEASLPSVLDADGLATSRRGTALMIKTADCQPILLAHEQGRFVAALHSGWKGNRQGYPRLAVEECCSRYGVDPSELWAVRGPSLGPAASEFVHFTEEWGSDFLPWFDEEMQRMDLWRLAKDQLVQAGLVPGRVLSIDLCTFENWKMFFSYRHFRKFGSKDGRQGSFIWIH